MSISPDQHSTVRFDYEPIRDIFDVNAHSYSDLLPEIICDTVPKHLRYKPHPSYPGWFVTPSATTDLAAKLRAAGYRITGTDRDQNPAGWARLLLEQYDKRYLDKIFTSLLPVMEIGEMRALAQAYDRASK